MGNSLRVKTLVSAVSVALIGLAFQPSAEARTAAPAAQSEARQSYLITFAEEGLVSYRGGVQGLMATSPQATGSRKLDMKSAAAINYAAYLESARANYIGLMQGAVGHALNVTHHYAVTHNGVAAELTASEAAAIAGVPGVRSVKLAGVEHQVTYRGPRFIGADKIWDGSATPTGAAGATRGEGLVAAILDGGTNSAHPSFANDAACGFSASTPKLVAVDCSTTGTGGVCNGPNPEANAGYGHGVHTSSTVAGNTIDNTVSPAPALPTGMTMSGVAPCATVHQYKVCATDTCGGADITAGINNAIADGADVLNFSISGGTSPWTDNDRKFLDAVDADIFVAAAAGNMRSTDTTPVGKVNHRGPWVMTVAASTQDMVVGPNLSVVGPVTPPTAATQVALNPGSNTAASATPNWTGKPIKAYPTNLLGCTASGAFPAGYFTGSIAIVRRGTCSFVEKVQNAYNAGAEFVVIANNAVGSLNMNTDAAPAVPNYSISMSAGDAIIAFLGDHATDSTADVKAIDVGTTTGDVIADFSYRGPTPGTLANLTKPDISAPGVNIYAATDHTSGDYEFMSGTSMATPHVAGAAALVRAVHPDWTVQEVKSAMMSTAKVDGLKEDETSPWNIDDVGSGRVDLGKAALAGFTLDETKARFLSANPSGGSMNVKDLNLPAVRNTACTPSCTFTRVVKNRLSTQATWNSSFQANSGGIMASVSPATFTLAPGATQTLTITVSPPYDTNMTSIGFGFLVFEEANGHSPDQHFSVAIKGNGGPAPDIIFADGFDDGTPVDLSFIENFDSYATNSQVAGQGGWKGWGNDNAAGAIVSGAQFVSAPNSIAIAGASDLIHEFDYASGSWTVTAKQFIPTTFSGKSYFIFENAYSDTNMGIISWSTQVSFDSATNTVGNAETDAANPGSATLIKGSWVDIKLVIDLDADLQSFYYNNTLLYSGSWTNQFPSQDVPGVAKIGSIDLFANDASVIYYDDIKIAPTTP